MALQHRAWDVDPSAPGLQLPQIQGAGTAAAGAVGAPDGETVLDLDERGEVVAPTFEHASSRANLANFSRELPAAA